MCNFALKKIQFDIFGNNEPGVGTILVEKSRHDRTDDKNLAEYLRKRYGGDYIILSDIAPQGVKAPDLLFHTHQKIPINDTKGSSRGGLCPDHSKK